MGPLMLLTLAGTVGGGLMQASNQMAAGRANAAAQKFQTQELQKQIKQAKNQAMDEEIRRRDDYQYLSSKNLAASAATGVMTDSASFDAIRKANRRTATRDIGLIRTNAAVARGQMAGQQAQHDMAAGAALSQGRSAAMNTMFDTGMSLLRGAPKMPKIGVIGG